MINRFIEAHRTRFDIAINELKAGQKQSHWMWYIFPQIEGLGSSYYAQYFAIKNLDEAKEYMNNPILRENMFEICKVLLEHKSKNVTKIFGTPDDLKLKSSMTLFALSNPEYTIFQKVLDKFYNGEMDEFTVNKIKEQYN